MRDLSVASWVMWISSGLVVAVGLDRVLLALEARGWIHWRRDPPSSTAAGNAMLSVQALLEPDREYTVEQRRDDETRRADPGDDEPH